MHHYLLVHQLMDFGLFPDFHCFEYSYYYLSHTDFCVDTWFHFSWLNPRSDIAWSFGMYMLNFIRNCQTRAVVLIYTPPAVCESCSCFMSLPRLDTINLFNFSHSSRYLVVKCFQLLLQPPYQVFICKQAFLLLEGIVFCCH